jgi:hypothetical protein
MTLNEEVARALGWTEVDGLWASDNSVHYPLPGFEHDWNAVYRWIVPAVKEMQLYAMTAFIRVVAERAGPHWNFDATPEDYCRAFLKVKA